MSPEVAAGISALMLLLLLTLAGGIVWWTVAGILDGARRMGRR